MPTAPPIRNKSDELALREGCYYDPAAGERVVAFVEKFCKQSKGEWSGKTIKLLDWQRDFILPLYGWKRPDGTRRFRTFYCEVAKKNGKSTLASGLTLYHLLADGEPGAEVYCLAYDLGQARIVFDEAHHMVKASPSLYKVLDPVPSAKRILHPASNSKLQALSADVPSKDGFNASYTLFDELHRQRTRSLWDIFKYAGKSRRQPLRGSITTAGFDRESICWEQHEYTRRINEGLIEDTTHFGVIYGATLNDPIDSPATWKKANPSIGVTLKEEDFASEVKQARENPAELNNFLRLSLNIWTQSDERYIPRDKWDACAGGPIDLADLEGLPCYGGLDLSSTTDVTAFVLIFGDTVQGFTVVPYFWLPEETARCREDREQVSYLTWGRMGLIKLTPGPVVDYAYVRTQINALAKRFKRLEKIYVDPHMATQLTHQLHDEDGLPVEYLRQGFISLNAPTQELMRLVMSRKLRHDANPVMDWMADNACAERDAAGSVKLSKKKSTEKIDGMAALVNAIAAATSGALEGPSVYESRGVITV